MTSTPTVPLPRFVVDPFWPKDLPGNWIMSQVGGVWVDKRDHIWVCQRPHLNTADEIAASLKPPRAMASLPAPPVLVFDQEGNVLNTWGGPGEGYDWPAKEDGIYVDMQDNVWVAGNGPHDRQVLKFTLDGKFIMQIGHPSTDPPDSTRSDILGQPAGFAVDEEAREVYIADGYLNRRVIVFDADNGTFKRLWGAYGNVPNDHDPGPYDASAPVDQQFRNPVHGVHISTDGLVYVCDRANNRIQVFTKAGKYIKEFFIARDTLGPYIDAIRPQCGSVWDLAFSRDPEQTYLLVADGSNNVIWTVRRSDGEILGSTGRAGRNAGQFHWLHHMAADSQGNLYTGEVDTGKRLQRFVLQKP
jgi:DNA-binding beta-propeller fold protein YncE